MKTSKIKSCKFLKSYTSKFGEMYSHLITFENGDSGEISAKSEMPDKFSAGREMSYEITPNPNPKYSPKIKAVQNNGNHDSEKSQLGREIVNALTKLSDEVESLKTTIKILVKENKLKYVAPKKDDYVPATSENDQDAPF